MVTDTSSYELHAFIADGSQLYRPSVLPTTSCRILRDHSNYVRPGCYDQHGNALDAGLPVGEYKSRHFNPATHSKYTVRFDAYYEMTRRVLVDQITRLARTTLIAHTMLKGIY